MNTGTKTKKEKKFQTKNKQKNKINKNDIYKTNGNHEKPKRYVTDFSNKEKFQ